MKILKILLSVFLLNIIASCAYLFNDKNVEVAINSTPSGADIFIEGRNYGRTPAIIKIEPKNYDVLLTKEGYGKAQLKLEAWQSVRLKKEEGSRCIADAVGTILILPAFSYWSVYCRDFKQPSYSVVIPYMGPVGTLKQRQNLNQKNEGGYYGYGY